MQQKSPPIWEGFKNILVNGINQGRSSIDIYRVKDHTC
jgi:hypothetical protein